MGGDSHHGGGRWVGGVDRMSMCLYINRMYIYIQVCQSCVYICVYVDREYIYNINIRAWVRVWVIAFVILMLNDAGQHS